MMQASPIAAALHGAASKLVGTQDTAPGVPTKSGVETQRPQFDQSNEGELLSAAIQHLIGERDRHRNRAAAQDAEIASLHAVNEELRRQNEGIALHRDHYLRLATELLTQLKHIDAAITESVQKTQHAAAKLEDRDATLVSLARRLSPAQECGK